MAGNPLLLGGLLNAGGSLIQGIFGGIQAARANKQFKRTLANRPEYEIPKEYQDILSKYQQAYAGNMPGYEQTLSQIGQAGARARGATERGAISSTAYGAKVGDLYQKELDALQNLGVQQAQYKQAQLDKVVGAEGAIAGQKEQQWNINKFVPWQTELNRYGEQRQAGVQNLFSGIQGAVGNISDLIGTKYYTDALKGLYPQNSASIGGNQSKPLGGTYNPLSNLTGNISNSLLNMTPYDRLQEQIRNMGYKTEG